MSEAERVYDEEIAPALLKLRERCKDLGFSFLASVEYEPDSVGLTAHEQPGAGVKWLLGRMAAFSKGDVDVLFAQLVRHAKAHGHSSAILSVLDRNLR